MYDCSDIGNSVGVYEDEEFVYPNMIRLSMEEVESTTMCLLDDGFNLFLYILNDDILDTLFSN